MLSATGRASTPLEDEAWSLLQAFNAELVRYQDADPLSPDAGGLWCPSCGQYHSRAAEALWPLAYEAARTGSFERRSQALALGRWLVARQGPDGAWTESEGGWKGTTTDQLLALTLAYPLLRRDLSWRERWEWRRAMRRAGDFLCAVMDIDYAYINYLATSSASLAQAGRLLHRRRFTRKARTLARFCISRMNEDGLLEGEGENEAGGKRGIDIGYNLEMSLWGLGRYAQLCHDALVRDAVERSARTHSAFIYPDGTLDASAGLRSSKWALWGSATADGCAPLWALLSDKDPRYADLALRNVRKLRESLSRSGLLAPGPGYDAVRDTLPCLYHTFTKAKGLACALDWGRPVPEADVAASWPDTLIYFPSLQTAIIRRGGFQGTICAYGYKARKADSKFMQRPTGGAMTLLWAEGFGLVQAASQTAYRRWEESFPWMPEVLPLTPRIEACRDSVYSTNLYDFDAALAVDSAFGCTVSGILKDRGQQPSGTAYTIRYRFTPEGLEKTYRVTGGDARIVEPIVFDEGVRSVSCDGRCARFERDSAMLLVTLSGAPGVLQMDTAAAPLHRQVYPALRCVPVVLDLPEEDSEEVRLTFRVASL